MTTLNTNSVQVCAPHLTSQEDAAINTQKWTRILDASQISIFRAHTNQSSQHFLWVHRNSHLLLLQQGFPPPTTLLPPIPQETHDLPPHATNLTGNSSPRPAAPSTPDSEPFARRDCSLRKLYMGRDTALENEGFQTKASKRRRSTKAFYVVCTTRHHSKSQEFAAPLELFALSSAQQAFN